MQTTTESKKSSRPVKSKAKKKVTAKKDTKKKDAVIAKTALAVVVPAATVAARKEAEKRIGVAREHLLQMHKNWFLFAKQLKQIRDERDEEKLKVESFRKLCEREFPTVDISHIYKMIMVVEKMGTEIERRLKNPTYLVPSSDACYYLTTLKRVNPDGTVQLKVPETEYDKLQKELLDSGIGSPTKSERLGYTRFRARIKELISNAKEKLRAEVTAETEKWADEEQRKLSQELKDNGITEEEEALDDDDFESSIEDLDMEDVDEDVDDETPADSVSTEALVARVDYLVENIPPYVEALNTIDGKTRDLLKKIKKLQTILTETTEALSGN